MSFLTLSPNMMLPIPTVGQEPGPDYATDINNSLTLIDQHDHAPGRGIQITPAGININSDFSINSHNLTFVNSTRYNSLSAALAGPSDLNCVYTVANDLYYNDGLGNNVRLTQSGAVAGTPGSISNLVPPASASYGANTFVFQSAANVAASVDGRNFILRNASASSKGLTLSPPGAMGSDFGITLPTLPANTSFTTISPTGVMGSGISTTAGITGSMIAAATVTADNIVTNPTFNGTVDSTVITRSRGLNAVVSNTNTTDNLAIVRGTVSSGGTILTGEGFTVAHVGTGIYEITVDTDFSDGPSPTCIPATQGGSINIFGGWDNTGSPALIRFRFKVEGGGLVNTDFSFTIIGLRTN